MTKEKSRGTDDSFISLLFVVICSARFHHCCPQIVDTSQPVLSMPWMHIRSLVSQRGRCLPLGGYSDVIPGVAKVMIHHSGHQSGDEPGGLRFSSIRESQIQLSSFDFICLYLKQT